MRSPACWTALLLPLMALPAAAADDLPWNVVLIVADDLGWSDLACYGNTLHQTPHLDQLARQGVRFSDAYAASPVCSPTRASLLTGRHPARLHMTIWRENAEIRGNRRLLEPVTRGDLPLAETTLAEVLQEEGYHTAHVGKWHLGRAEAYPEPHGFDVNIGGTLWGAPQTFFYPYRGDQYFQDWRYVPDLEPGSPGDYLTDRLTDKALEIIERSKDGPFFLNLWYHSVHTPIEGRADLVAKYEQQIAAQPASPWRNPHYAAMVESLDQNVGRVLDKLNETGLAQQTIVIFTSDNGGFVNTCKLHPERPVTSNAPLRSGKGSCYEGGLRVPLIVRWPDHAPEGAECRLPVTSCDLFPTVLGILGRQTPVDLLLDGIELTAVLRDPASELPNRDLFFHYPHYYATTTPVSAVRAGDWKLLEYFEEGRVELYNLAEDIGEQRDLANLHPERVRSLRQELDRWRSDVSAQLPEPNPDWKAQK